MNSFLSSPCPPAGLWGVSHPNHLPCSPSPPRHPEPLGSLPCSVLGHQEGQTKAEPPSPCAGLPELARGKFWGVLGIFPQQRKFWEHSRSWEVCDPQNPKSWGEISSALSTPGSFSCSPQDLQHTIPAPGALFRTCLPTNLGHKKARGEGGRGDLIFSLCDEFLLLWGVGRGAESLGARGEWGSASPS